MTTAQIALDYDGTDDDETDMSMRGGRMIARITKRNRRGSGGAVAQCGHCDEYLDGSPAEAWAHVKQCEEDNREYSYR